MPLPEPAPARNWNRPLLLPVPPGMLRAGANRIDVALAVQPTYPGVLAPAYLGPEAALRPVYEWRLFWQVTAVQLSVLLTAYWGLAGAFLWLRRREPPGLAWAAAGCLLWALAMLDPVLREPPLPVLVWQWTVTSALAASIACFAIGMRRFVSVGGTRADVVVAAAWAAGSAALALALASGPRAVEAVILVWAAVLLAIAFFLTRLLVLVPRRAASSERAALGYLAPLAAVALAFALHDLAVASGFPVPPAVLLVPYVGGLIALWGGVRIVERLAAALSESAALNRGLERRVAERGAEIARSYEQIRALERARLLQGERERIMRDVHDGMGGQLASALALVEGRRVPPEEIADALRDALDDMRLLIAPLGPTADDLLTLLATWRARIERRLARRGLAFDWQVSDVPALPWLGPREALHVLRIFQEAVTNVVKHADATSILLRTAAGDGPGGAPGIVVEIGDDGRGVAGDRAARGGHGLRNMAARAAELGGTIEVRSTDASTRVVLWLPLAR